MNSSQRVQACRLCLAMNIKLLEIEMGLKNSVKSMLGENVYYTSGLPSYVCFECAAQLRKYTKFRRKCRRVQTFLYGILKSNGEVTEEELNKIDRKKLGLESSLSIRTVALESYSQPTEVIKEEIVDSDLGLTVEDNIDIKIEKPSFDDTYYDQEHDDMSTLTDVNNIQTHRNWNPQNRKDEFLEYMATLGTGPYLKERKMKNHKMTKVDLRNSGNHHNSVSNDIGNYTLPNIKLPLSTTITPVIPLNNIDCKKISEFERCERDVNGETISILPDVEIKLARMTQCKELSRTCDIPMSQVQVEVQVKHSENLRKFVVHDLDTINDTANNRRIFGRHANGKINSNNDNDLQQDKFYIVDDFGINKKSHTSSVTNKQTNFKEKRENPGQMTYANIAKIDVNEYMEAIELIPHKRVRVNGKNKQLQSFDVSCENKKGKHNNKMEDPVFTTVTNYQNNEHVIVPKQEQNQVKGDLRISKIVATYNNLISLDVQDSDKNNLLIDRNIANKNIKPNKYDSIEMNKVICRVIKKDSKVEYKTNHLSQDLKIKNERSKNNKGSKAKKKRRHTNADGTLCKPRKKVVHRHWTKEEMEVVCRRFCQELSLKQNPGIAKCKLVLEQEPLLSGRTWMQLNSCVNNIYMKKIKNQRRLAAKLEQGRPVPFHSHLSLPTQVLAMRRVSGGESLN